MTDIRTMNLSDNSDAGMVQLNPSTSFITQNNEEKNVSKNIFIQLTFFDVSGGYLRLCR